MATFYVVQNDAGISMIGTLKDGNGTAIDLTDASEVRFHCGYEGEPASVLVNGFCTVLDAENGRIKYIWTAEDTVLEAGVTYAGEFQITWPGGTIVTVPSKAGGFKVVVKGEVG